MDAYAEVVVNRPLIRHEKITHADKTTTIEPQELAETRLKTFTYHVPDHLQGLLQVGHLVAVPFRQQLLQGVVVAMPDHSAVEKTRPIEAILDPVPVITASQLALARWLAEGYLAPLTTCLSFFLPPGSNRQPLTVLELIPEAPLPNDLTPLERALQIYLQQQKSPTPVDDLEPEVVNGLVRKGLARRRTTLTKPAVGPRIERTIELLISSEEIEEALLDLGRPSKQADILRTMATLDDPLPGVEALCQTVGCSESPVKALVARGWLEHHPSQTLVALSPTQAENLDLAGLKADQQAALTILKSTAMPQPVAELALNPQSIRELVEAGRVLLLTEPDRVALNIPLAEIPAAILELRGTEHHAAVLNLLAEEEDPVWVGWVYAQTEANAKTLKDLAEAELIVFDEARRWRDPLAERTFTISTPPPMTDEQRDIFAAICPTLDRHGRPHLIHGVTGSGKTEIYLRAIEIVLQRDQGVIFLVPEVMLATQIVERVQARFPGKVALWHSSLSPGERYDTWERVRNGELAIVVGPRSALFAPLQKPGLLIVDEEHEPAYKQQLVPTFHAREAAIEYARLNDIPVLMGSATPDVVTYRKAQRGEFQLHHLPNRILAHKKHLVVQATLLRRQQKERAAESLEPATASSPTDDFVALPMPPVEIVDLREELRAGNRSIFSRPLAAAMEATLAAGEQVILFLNRRGTATFVLCRDCGYVMSCPQCDTTLTYHAANELLACHYCGYRTEVRSTCPVCNRNRIRYFGLGTERVEEALRQSFPQARPIRFDRDTTRKLGSHYAFLQEFVEGRANVMIGTQMVAKGLDLPLVTLVGVISADTALYLPDFQAAERTFQVLMQVAGRAGRSPLGGRVILQTYTPDQPAIIAASQHDYLGFYQAELRFRYERGYPPFKRLARLLYTGSGRQRSLLMAEEIAQRLRIWVAQQGFPAVEIIGPAPAYVQHVRSKYRWQIIVRAPNPASILGPVPLPPGCRVDIDPVNLL